MVLHGVDFSGADSGGAHKIRVATRAWRTARGTEPNVTVERMDRRGLLERIRASASDGSAHLWRIDAPVGLAAATLDAHGLPHDWLSCAKWMAQCGGARPWRAALRAVDRTEPRRIADAEARTPMAPMNLRVFKQTWTLVCEILLPLAQERVVSIEPMAPVHGATCSVGEGCPASVLHRAGWPARAYKGEGDPPRRVREEILRRLRGAGVRMAAPVEREAAADVEGDMVDAMLLATDPPSTVVPAAAAFEGWVW